MNFSLRDIVSASRLAPVSLLSSDKFRFTLLEARRSSLCAFGAGTISMSDWLEEFRKTIERSAEQLLLISEEQSAVAPAERKWSAKEIVGHLIDSAANNHQRFVRAQFTDDLVFPGYEQDDWVRVQRYNDEAWSQLVQLWRHYNLHLLHLMSNVPEQTLTRPRTRHNLHQLAWRTVSESETVTLEYFIRDYIQHLQHHLRQISDAAASHSERNGLSN